MIKPTINDLVVSPQPCQVGRIPRNSFLSAAYILSLTGCSSIGICNKIDWANTDIYGVHIRMHTLAHAYMHTAHTHTCIHAHAQRARTHACMYTQHIHSWILMPVVSMDDQVLCQVWLGKCDHRQSVHIFTTHMTPHTVAMIYNTHDTTHCSHNIIQGAW